MKVAIQNSEYGQRGGIGTYSNRLCRYLNQLKDVEAEQFVNKYRGKADIFCIQYEPGCTPPQKLNWFLMNLEEPIVVTAHHTLQLPQFYPMLDGVVLHSDKQINDKPWSYKVIPHPALVYKKKDKKKLRQKYGLPIDKKIVGTMGFIHGTGKVLPASVHHILKNLKEDEFLYLITPFWKGGDNGRLKEITDVVTELGKENQFKIEPDFTVDEEILNEKMQCCDLMYAWNNTDIHAPGGQSGSAADMYGARVKVILKDSPHYEFLLQQDKVLKGRPGIVEFCEDILKALREEDLSDVQDPTWLSWEEQIKEYVEYFKEVLGE